MLPFCKNKDLPFSSGSNVCAIDQIRRSAADTAVVLECQKGLALSFRLSGLEDWLLQPSGSEDWLLQLGGLEDWLLQLSGLEDYRRGIHSIHHLGKELYTDRWLQLFVLQNFDNQFPQQITVDP